MNRVLVVPWSIAPTYSAIGRAPPRSSSVAAPGVGDGLQEQERRRRAGILVPGAPFAEIARPAFACYPWDGRLHPFLRRARRAPQRVGERAAVGERLVVRIAPGDER